MAIRGFGRNGWYEQKQSWGSRPTQSLPEFRPLLPSGILLPPNESSSLLPLEHTFHSLLQTSEPDYLYDTEAKRGRLEKSFTAIGSSVCLGAGAGGAYGLFDGIRWAFQLKLDGPVHLNTIYVQHYIKLIYKFLGKQLRVTCQGDSEEHRCENRQFTMENVDIMVLDDASELSR